MKVPGEALFYGPHIRRSNFAGIYIKTLSVLAILLMPESFLDLDKIRP
jgi:hypothetical protein